MGRPRRDANLVVIGAGSAGLVAAYVAAALRARVVLVERERMGGDCLHSGCVPSKSLIASARFLAAVRRHADYGIAEASARFDFGEVMDRIRRNIAAIEPNDSAERYERLGVRCLRGEARVVSPREVAVNGRVVTTGGIVVASGANPVVPPVPGLQTVPYRTSETIWNLTRLPQRLAVLGGGAIGCELAQAFARLGSRVTVIEAAADILPREDADVAAAVREALIADGVEIADGCRAESALHRDDGIDIALGGARRDIVRCDECLVAVGRRAAVRGFGLEELGVKLRDDGALACDALLETSVPGIFACGDATALQQFTHIAGHQGGVAAVNALFRPLARLRAESRLVPRATFTDPEVAAIGLNERQAQARGIALEVHRLAIGALDRAVTDSKRNGFVKVLTAPGRDRIIGVTVVAADGAELLAPYSLAMRHGIGLRALLRHIHPYPTLAEAASRIAGEWQRHHVRPWQLALAERFLRWRRGA